MIFSPEQIDVGRRIDLYVAEQCEITRSATQKLLEENCISVNGKIVTKNYKIRQGDWVEVVLPEAVPCDLVPQNLPIEIVYEDTDLLVVNKPKGMVVHPAPGNSDGTLVNALLYHCGDRLSGINGVLRPGIVHRIDKDTSGLLMVAKSDAAHLGLAKQIHDHDFYRSYQAVSVGSWKEPVGTIDAPIGRNPKDRKKMAIVPDGRNAITHYEVLKPYIGYTHLKLILETGRTHQIRVHLSSKGRPIFGDEVYGAGQTTLEKQLQSVVKGQCLHAKEIGFVHPITGEKMYFTSELPDYFQTVLSRLKEEK